MSRWFDVCLWIVVVLIAVGMCGLAQAQRCCSREQRSSDRDDGSELENVTPETATETEDPPSRWQIASDRRSRRNGQAETTGMSGLGSITDKLHALAGRVEGLPGPLDLSAIETRLEQLGNRLDQIAIASPVDMSGIERHLQDLDRRLTDLAAGAGDLPAITDRLDRLAASIDDLEPSGSVDLLPITEQLAAIAARLTRLDDRLAAIEASRSSPEILTTGQASQVDQILYFTARGCSSCIATDQQAEALRDRGAPITIITLDPVDTQARGLPRLFLLPTRRQIMGVSNVDTYLHRF